MQQAQVVRFYGWKEKGTGYGFLGVRQHPKGLFFHTEPGKKLNATGTEFTEEKETRMPQVGDDLFYVEGKSKMPGKEGKQEAVIWAFVNQGEV